MLILSNAARSHLRGTIFYFPASSPLGAKFCQLPAVA